MKLPTNRIIFFVIGLLCTLSVAYAFYAEFYQKIEPCPLCIVQRVIIGLIAVLAFIYAIHNPQNIITKIYGLVLIFLSAFGIKVAAHHLWLMSLPPEQQPLSCGMPLAMLYQRVPLNSFLHTVLQGDAECGKIIWKIFGITPPIAVIILCSIVIILSLIIIFRKLNKNGC
jgi:disulfide bond formation protein DsbB